MPTIARCFVTVGSREQFYRRAGSGPPVVLLHQSPRTSAEHIPLIEMLAERRTVLAPDTPGFGLSAPLEPQALGPIDPFALAVADFMDAVGIERAPVYGFHTGCSIATRLARLRPDKVSLLIANGTVVLDAAERADFKTHYLPPLRPQFDGGHLLWTWRRVRDQSIFFPWYRRTAAARMPIPAPTPERVHEVVMDFLAAGDAYRFAYYGAFDYENVRDIPEIAPPAVYVAADPDPLTAGLPGFPPLPAQARIVRPPSFEAAWEATRDLVFAHPADPEAVPRDAAAAGRWASAFVTTPMGALRVRRSAGGGRTFVLLPDLAGSSAGLVALGEALAGAGANVWAIDPLGHGDSDDGPDAEHLSGQVRAIAAALAGVGEVTLAGVGWGGALALGVAQALGAAATRVELLAPRWREPAEAQAWLPDLRIDPDGAHLLRAWRFAQDRRLFDPWHTPWAGQAIPVGSLDLEETHQDAVDALKAARAAPLLLRELATFDWAAAIAGVRAATVRLSEWSADRARWPDAARLPATPQELAQALLDT